MMRKQKWATSAPPRCHSYSGNKTALTVDYSYDVNGNMVKDLNKDMVSFSGGDGIAYNHLNLPQTITVKKDATTNKGTITYTYYAAGNKLKKVTSETNATVAYNGGNYISNITTTTTYLGGLVYESKSYNNSLLSALQYSDVLQFVTHEKGRIRFVKTTTATCMAMPDRLIYDYFIKDHLGNTRMVLTEQNEPICYPALTFEGAVGSTEIQNQDNTWENKTGQSINVNSVRIIRPGSFGTSGTNGTYAQLVRKSTGAIGAAKLLKVMAGDRIHTSVDYYYATTNANNTGASGITSLVANFMSAIGGSAAVSGVLKDGASTITNALNSNSVLSGLLNTANNTSGTNQAPKAYLNIIFFDEQFKFDDVASTVVPVGYTPGVKGTINKMAANAITAKKSGYVYVYFSNESDEFVYFDNFMLTHEAGPILEETHYYPFGLTMSGISSKALKSNYAENKYKFTGQLLDDDLELNWYQLRFRNMDPQIGRFVQVDPLADKYVYNSTYAYAENRVIDGIDLEGLEYKESKTVDNNGATKKVHFEINVKVVNSTSEMSNERVMGIMASSKTLMEKQLIAGKNAEGAEVTSTLTYELTTADKVDAAKDFYVEFVDIITTSSGEEIFESGYTNEIGNTTNNKFQVLSEGVWMALGETDPIANKESMAKTVAHEIGHGGGLRHVDDPKNPGAVVKGMDYNNFMRAEAVKPYNSTPQQMSQISLHIPDSQRIIKTEEKKK